jgi:3-oxoacyl-[acyl-carrier protein] reductase
MTDLRGRTAIVTGSARGLGRAIAVRLGSLGANVVVNYAHGQAAAEETAAEIRRVGGGAVAVRADVSHVEDLEGLFADAERAFGKPDIVVVNAGLEHTGLPVADFTEEQFDQLFAVNTKGAFFTLQMAARTVADNGRILYISSSTAGYPMPGYSVHGGSKIAPEYLVEVLAREAGKRGITVNTIRPTATEGAGLHTDVAADSPIRGFVSNFNPMGRMGTPEDVANVVELFVSDLASFVSGQTLLVAGGAPA